MPPLWLVVVALANGRAQEHPLTLADCQRLAESAPSALTLARTDIRIASAGVGAAKAGFLPHAGIASGYTYNSPLREQQAFIALNAVREYQAVAAVNLEVDTSGRLRAELARARADREIAEANTVLARRDLRRAVATAYYRVLLARHLEEATRASLAEANSFLERSRKLFGGGEAARADVVKAESQSAFLEQAVTASALEAQLANQELASFWTTDVNTRLSLVDSLSNPTPPEEASTNQSSSYMTRPEFNLFAAERRGFEADYRRERSGLFPQLGVVYQYGIDAPVVSWSERGSAFFATLNIPLFDFFRVRNTARQFSLRAEQSDTNRTIATRTFSKEYEAALARSRLVWQQVSTTDTQVRSSEENLKLSRLRYEGGEGPALDVVAAQQQLQQARTNYYTVLADYANAVADLEVARGK